MSRTLVLLAAAISIAGMAALSSCGASKQPPQKPEGDTGEDAAKADKEDVMRDGIPESKISGELVFPAVPKSPGDMESLCKTNLDAARAKRDELVAVEGERSVDNTLTTFNDVFISIYHVLPFSELMANVHPDKEVRTSAEKCQQDAMKLVTDLGLDREVYDALAALDADKLDPLARRSLEHHLRDYRRSGVDKDEATRKKLAELSEEMVKTGQEFSRRIREDRRFVEVKKKDLDGMPEDFIKAHKPEKKGGKIKISTDYPDFFPIQNYANSPQVRKDLYTKFLSRAYPDNEATLKKLLELRHEYATILGYPNWAQYNAEDKMARDQKTIADFIDRVADIARPRMNNDLEQILARKKKDDPEATDVKVWDRFYYVKKIQEEEFGVDSQEVRKYFDYEKVRDGILEVNQELLGLKFVKVGDAETWHSDVEAYDVMDGDALIGRFFLDMHPREGKYGHAAMFNVITGITDRQIPVATLVCNFPQPSKDGPALMEHGDVTTFFHEFGHLMHHLLGSGYPWVNLSGIACEWDFVETPSQLMEEWAWDAKVLSRFARHYETGEAIPAELVKKMRDADEFGKGVHVMRQMFYAGLSFNYHVVDPANLDLKAKLLEVQKKYNPYPYEDGTCVYANFGHIEGYSSMYYTYMWSLNLSKDVFTRFEKEGLMNKQVAADYRRFVIGAGGAVDATDQVKNFLGRESTFDAFEAYLKK